MFVCSGLEEFNFSSSTSSKSGQNFATSLVPLRKLLFSNGIEVFTSVHPFPQGGCLEASTAHIIAPRHQSSNLVRVEVSLDVGANAGVKSSKIVLEVRLSLGLTNGKAFLDVGAGMTIADGPHTHRILIGRESAALKFLNEVNGASYIPSHSLHAYVCSFLVLMVVVVFSNDEHSHRTQRNQYSFDHPLFYYYNNYCCI